SIAGTLAATTNQSQTLYFYDIRMNGGTLTSTVSNTTATGAFYAGTWYPSITASGTGNTISGTGVIGIASGIDLALSTPLATDSLSVTGTIGQGASGTAGSVTKYGFGNLTFSGSNTYTGTTSINAGTLTLDYTVAASKIADTSAVVL